jgi:hypothetical protein
MELKNSMLVLDQRGRNLLLLVDTNLESAPQSAKRPAHHSIIHTKLRATTSMNSVKQKARRSTNMSAHNRTNLMPECKSTKLAGHICKMLVTWSRVWCYFENISILYLVLIFVLTGLNTCFWSFGLEELEQTRMPPPIDAMYAATRMRFLDCSPCSAGHQPYFPATSREVLSQSRRVPRWRVPRIMIYLTSNE